MTRAECLDAAAQCVLKDRQNQYGGPENNFERIAQMWNGDLGINGIKPWDVAAMMGMLKMARARFNPKYADNWVDLAGYAACGIECATVQEEFDKALDKHQQEIFDRMFNKAGGNHPEIPDSSPEFKRGDRVQFRDEIPSTSEPHWFEGVYVERLSTGGHAVKFGPHGHVIHCSDKDIRPAPKAEGCEELVQDEESDVDRVFGTMKKRPAPEYDAPQTKEELFRRIVEVNPATYPGVDPDTLNARAHTPTGEELAEMAQEDVQHG